MIKFEDSKPDEADEIYAKKQAAKEILSVFARGFLPFSRGPFATFSEVSKYKMWHSRPRLCFDRHEISL